MGRNIGGREQCGHNVGAPLVLMVISLVGKKSILYHFCLLCQIFYDFPLKDGGDSTLVGVMSRGGFKGRGCGKT